MAIRYVKPFCKHSKHTSHNYLKKVKEGLKKVKKGSKRTSTVCWKRLSAINYAKHSKLLELNRLPFLYSSFSPRKQNS